MKSKPDPPLALGTVSAADVRLCLVPPLRRPRACDRVESVVAGPAVNKCPNVPVASRLAGLVEYRGDRLVGISKCLT
jgi:hypothetical protein